MGEYRTSRWKLYETANQSVVQPNRVDTNKNGKSFLRDDYAQVKLIRRLWRLGIWATIYGTLLITSQLTFSPTGHGPGVDGKPLDITIDQEVNGIWTGLQSEEILKSELNCTPQGISNFPPDLFTKGQRQNGAVVVHFLVSLYIFYGLLLICDDYFVPSVESICQELRISSDVGGATFMAMSTSAPELFTNFIGTFVTEGDMGIGTIVGSAVFNVLVVATACGIGSAWTVNQVKDGRDRKGLPLEWFPLTRDTVFYLLAVGALILVLYDLRIDWYEALGLLILYGLYILVLRYNGAVKRFSERIVYKIQSCCCHGGGKKRRKMSMAGGGQVVKSRSQSRRPSETTPLLFTESEKGVVKPAKIDGEPPKEDQEDESLSSSSDMSLSSEEFDGFMISIALSRSVSQYLETKTEWGVFSLPWGESWKIWLEYIVAWPIRLAFTMTIPDCRLDNFRNWYPLTLIMCIVWIAGLSYIVSWMMTVIGDTLGIPDSVTGLSILAAGTSIPEIVSSIIVARQGLGAMALSNSVGSNTFDILICLGFPWLVKLLVISTSEINYIQITSEGMEYSAMLMVGTIILLYVVLAWNGFLLDVKVGVVSLIMYIIFITLAILLEMNIFLDVHLPPCSD